MATAGWVRRQRGGRNGPGGRDSEGAPAEGDPPVGGPSVAGALSATAPRRSSGAALSLAFTSFTSFAACAALALALASALALALALAAPAGTAGAAQRSESSPHTQRIHLSTAKVPHVGTVLTTGAGLTLYRFTANPAGMSTCTGSCANIWPPLLAAKGDHIAGPRGVKGLSLIDVGGAHWQVAFHDVALYRFEGDAKKGQAKGQGIAHEWFAVLKSGIPAGTAGGKAAAGAGATSTTTTTAPTGSTTTQAPQSVTSPPAPAQTPVTQAPAPAPTTTPTTASPPTTTPTTQPPTTTTTMGGGYGY